MVDEYEELNQNDEVDEFDGAKGDNDAGDVAE